MRKLLGSMFLTFGLLCCIAPLGANAQLLSKIKIGYVVPQGADPPILVDFLSFGTPVTLSGADLLDNGVEIHDLIPAPNKHGYLVDVTQIELTFTFNHPVSIAFGSGTWAPWSLTILSGKPNYDLIFEAQGPVGLPGGSAPINENFDPLNGNSTSFGLINAIPIADTDGILERDFRNATITVTPVESNGAVSRGTPSIPEPGSLALGTMSIAAISMSVLKSRRKS